MRVKIIIYLKKALFVLLLFGTINAIAQTSPGNVSMNLQLWMKANTGTSTTTNGSAVNTWNDNSSNSLVATKESTNGPIYTSDVINFNPSLKFNGSQFFNLGQPSALNITPTPTATNSSSMSIFAAFLTDQSGAGTIISRGDSNTGRSFQLWLGNTDRVVHYTLGRLSGVSASDTRGGINYGTIHARNDPKISSAIIDVTSPGPDPNINKIQRYVNGFLDPLTIKDNGDNGFGTGEKAVDILIGARRSSNNSGSGNRVQGDISEIIIYDRALTTIEKQKVETYLAIKYGITLGYNDEYYKEEETPDLSTFGYSGTSNDYIASNGAALWTGSQNSGYGYNVFGIARDDDSDLLQLKSKSVHIEEITKATSILTIEDESSSIANDKAFLLVGNNGASVAFQSTVLPERTTNTLNRKWKARESANDVGTVKLDFDLTQYPGVYGTNPNEIELLISENEDLSNYKNYQGSYNSFTNTISFNGIDFEDADYFTLGRLETLKNSHHLTFNGSSQYIDLSDNNDLTGRFTISTWINSNVNNRTIVSKGSGSGYEFIINGSGNLEMNWQNFGTQSVTSTNSVPLNIWHHVAVIYNGSTAKIYIDGVEDGTANISASPVNNSNAFLIGASGNTPSNFFSGEMDELRVWNRALTVDQLRFIMNQEIEASGGNVYGKIIPQTITKHETSTIPWNDLMAYYPYTRVRGNCLFNESLNISENGRLYNTPTSSIENQTTPLPFVSNNNTDWDTSNTWLYGSVQYIPNATINGTRVNWNIVDISHNISVNRDVSVLGLISNSNELQVNGTTTASGTGTGHGLTISHYLNLDGIIDLEGESQLVQTEGSDLDINSSGSIERDQQGTKDLYTYNYWSSPVGRRISGSNNNNFNLSNNILKNGTIASSPNNITFLNSGVNGSISGTNISIANRWIWKYANAASDTYALWQKVGSSNTILIGEGFTMKGVESSGSSFTSKQNYVFDGKPNNGDVVLTIFSGNDYLIGNPYPSAIDADEFIKDNIADGPGRASSNIINGALYFWDHFANNTHVLKDYEGGYATYTLIGAVAAISNDTRINASLATGSITPQQYIPVGQGFFVSTEIDIALTGIAVITGGDVTFKNSQRAFVTEASANSVFFKNSNTKSKKENTNLKPRIRLNFDSPIGYHRELLVGIDEEYASNNFDVGYDAPLIENNEEDMFWLFNNNPFIIQGVNNFDPEQILPIGIKTAEDGLASIKINKLENIPSNLNIYLHDNVLDIYHDLREGKYKTYLTSGEYLNRFEITFSKVKILDADNNTNKQFEVYYSNKKSSIVIHNPVEKLIESVEMINILGQTLFKSTTNSNANYMEYNAGQIKAGNYILKINSEFKTISKKVLIK